MKGKKYITYFSAGLIAVLGNFGNLGRTVDLTLPTPTPVASFKPALIKPNLIKNLEKIELKYTNKRGELSNVKVIAKDTTSITVDNGGVSVKVDVQTNTHFRRKFWGKSTLGEISVGDSVDVIGRWTSEAKTKIKAVVIRDLSIPKRFGTFFGTVKSIIDTGFIMTTIQRGDETVTFDTAKLINRKGQTITATDIQIGHKVRVRGLWDSAAFTITELTEVKDFSLPPFTSPSPTP